MKKIFLSLALILLTACASTAPQAAPPATQGSTPEPLAAPTDVPATVAGPSSGSEAGTSPAPVPPAEAETGMSEEQAVLSSFSQTVTAQGEPLVLYGHLLDPGGAPLSGYAVEIWQVDANGIYDHPGDVNTGRRDMGFQFYGTALTDENGLFAFRTLVPARYEPRPKHIHFKVKQNGREVLTSQFYFSGEVDAAQLGPAGEMLLLELRDATDGSGSPVKLAFRDIVVGAGGGLTLTPAQMEGPYYPVVDVAAFDNDLLSVP